MGVNILRNQKKSQYKYVRYYESDIGNGWKAQIPKFRWTAFFDDERKAAIAVDKKFIEKGLKPVNILVAK